MSAYASLNLSDQNPAIPLHAEDLAFNISHPNEDITDPHQILGEKLHQQQLDETLLETNEEVTQSNTKPVVIQFSLLDILRKGAINLVLPFINGIMLGFGEILAHEIGFKYGYVGSRVQPPRRRLQRESRFI